MLPVEATLDTALPESLVPNKQRQPTSGEILPAPPPVAPHQQKAERSEKKAEPSRREQQVAPSRMKGSHRDGNSRARRRAMAALS